MTVVVTELAQDERGNHRFQGAATLGDGTKKVLGIHEDRDTAKGIAERKAQRAERELAAIETHDPEDLAGIVKDGYRMLTDPNGTVVEVPEHMVELALAGGYTAADDGAIPQRSPEDVAGPVGLKQRESNANVLPVARQVDPEDAIHPRRRRQQRKQEPSDSEME